MVRQTHTFVTLPVTPAVYDEIAVKLREAGYDHVFIETSKDIVMDMHGIALQRLPEGNNPPTDAKQG